jgi:hypothetical protein
MFARFSMSQAEDEEGMCSWYACPNLFGVEAMTYQANTMSFYLRGSESDRAQINLLKALTRVHWSQRKKICANELRMAWLTTNMDHYHVIASGCLPESETIAVGIVLDYGLGHLTGMDWCSQAWIKHWNLDDEVDENVSNTWPRRLKHDRRKRHDDLVRRVEQAITFPPEFLIRTSSFHSAFKAILDKQRSIYQALNTLCGKHTTRTATMNFNAVRPWNQFFTLEAHDAPFVDGTSELLMTNFRALISSGILLDVRWGMSSHSHHQTVVLRACLDLSASRWGKLVPYFDSARRDHGTVVIYIYSTATRCHEYLNHVLSDGIFHRADPHTVYSKKHLLEQFAIYDMVFAVTILMKDALSTSTMKFPTNKSNADRERAVFVENQILKRNQLNPLPLNYQQFRLQYQEKRKPSQSPSPSNQAAKTQNKRKSALNIVYR